MPALLALLLVAGLCPTILCQPGSTTEPETVTQEEGHSTTLARRLARSNSDFAFSLYKQLALKTPNENVVFSPLSISMALALLSLGARSSTLTEILEGLKFNLTDTPEPEIHQGFQHLLSILGRNHSERQLSVGNALFVGEHLQVLDSFREAARVLYTSDCFPTNFQKSAAAMKLINDYVEEKTQGKITNLIKNLDQDLAMVLVNYITLKAKWKTPFDPRDTFKSKFQVSPRRSVKVPMMTLENLVAPFFRDEELSCTVLELQYTSKDRALFVLPDKGKMKTVEARLHPEILRRWQDNLKPTMIDSLFLPKFSISGDYDLRDILSQVGIQEVFSRQANLSGISEDQSLAVSQVVHKAVLNVAEEGTEAAVATGIKIIPLSGKIGPLITLQFNRAFLMIVFTNDMETILFLSKVANPNGV